MTVSDWGMTFNGLTLGVGTPYKITRITGFQDAPGVRTSDSDRARAHGQFMGSDLLGGRSVQVEFMVVAPHPAEADWSAFSAAMVVGQPTEMPLVVRTPGVAGGVEVRVNARVRRLGLPVDLDYHFAGVGRAVVEWWCTDPRIYAATATEVSTSVADVSGTGRTYNRTYPMDFGGATSGGLVTAENAGEFPAPWTAVLTGPVTNPRVENVTTGRTLRFGGTLAAGDSLALDSLNKTVILNGTASRYAWLLAGSEWFDLDPGDNEVRFAASAGSGSMQLTFRSAWI